MNAEHYQMRAACPRCGAGEGFLVTRNGQDTVRCAHCRFFCYNAPKTETGRAVRPIVERRKGLKPSKRARILERDGFRCLRCGRSPTKHNVVLVVGHVQSVKEGTALGMALVDLNDDDNLETQCEECNAGQGGRSYPGGA